MDKRKFFTFLYVVLIIGVLLFMVWFVSWLKSESAMCMKSPITYFEEKNEGASCSCYKDGVKWPNTVSTQNTPFDIKLDDFVSNDLNNTYP